MHAALPMASADSVRSKGEQARVPVAVTEAIAAFVPPVGYERVPPTSQESSLIYDWGVRLVAGGRVSWVCLASATCRRSFVRYMLSAGKTSRATKHLGEVHGIASAKVAAENKRKRDAVDAESSGVATADASVPPIARKQLRIEPIALVLPTSTPFQLLRKTTAAKLRELSKHEGRLEAHYEALLAANQDDVYTQPTADALRRQLHGLYDGVRSLQVMQSPVHPGVKGVGELVAFAGADPWSTKRVLQQQTQRIRRDIGYKRALWRHNELLGALLLEALDETDAVQKAARARAYEQQQQYARPIGNGIGAPLATAATSYGTNAGPHGTVERAQTRFETSFFTPSSVRETDVLAFLETSHTRVAFSKEKTKRAQDALTSARAALRGFSDSFRARTVTSADARVCVAAMLCEKASFSADVVAFLEDATSSASMQVELAHVLTIELSHLAEFQWPVDGVAVELKRDRDGRSRCVLQEDAHSALLFHYVGLVWAVAVRAELAKLLDAVTDERQFDAGSVEAHRVAARERFRLHALPATFDGSDTADSVAKHDIVRLVLADAHLGRALRDASTAATSPSSLTAVATDLDFFGPSVSHEAVFACLRFLGLDDATLAIFRSYVRVPLVFPGTSARPQLMRRGLSVGRMMTTLLSEVLLFVVDYQVLVETGLPLYRLHDSMWLFDADERTVARAWREMWRVADVLGLEFNADTSGSLRVDCENTNAASETETETEIETAASSAAELSGDVLPPRSITWRLLVLQADGTVEIATEQVAAFALELADRLAAAGSVLAWVNVYNTYMGDFQRNVGNVSPVFGLAFVDTALATLRDIHARVFRFTHGDVLASLSAKIAAIHSALVVDGGAPWLLPAALAHWPMELGGLGLVNPFLAVWALKEPLLAHLQAHHTAPDTGWPKLSIVRWEWRPPFATSVRLDIDEPFDHFSDSVATHGVQWAAHHVCEHQFLFLQSSEASDEQRWAARGKDDNALDTSYALRPFSDVLALAPRVRLERVAREFAALVNEAAATDPPVRSVAAQEAVGLLEAAGAGGAYWKWVAIIYSEQLETEFGAVAFVSRELLPMQLIHAVQSAGVSW